MSENKDYTELIEKYLDGELSAKEQLSFEQELSANPELQQQLEFYQLAYAGIVQHKLSEVKETIQEVKQEYKSRKKRQKVRNYVVASAVILLSGTGVFYTLKNSSSQKENTNKQELIVVDTTQNSVYKESIQHKTEKKKPESIGNNSTDVIQYQSKKTRPDNYEKPLPGPTVITNDSLIQPEAKIKKRAIDSSAFIQKKVKTQSENKEEPDTAKKERKDDNASEPCEKVTITFTVTAKETCKGKEEGVIYVSQTQGGTAPYEYELSNGEKTTDTRFTNLPAGVYTLYVNDYNNCKQTVKNIAVKEKLCKLNLYFDPSSAQPLVLPEYENAGQLSIFDKQGVLKFNDIIESNTSYEWFGESNSGTLSPGYYLLLIKFEDGSVQNGSITIIP